MAPPTWSVGQVLTASDVNTWFVSRAAYTASAEHSANTVLANSASLVLPVDANALYAWVLYLNYDGGGTRTGATGGLNFNFTVPSGTTAAYQYIGENAAGNDETRLGWVLPGSTQIGGTEGAGNLRSLTLVGSVDTAATAGNFQLEFSRNSNTSGVDTIVHAGSYMTLERIG